MTDPIEIMARAHWRSTSRPSSRSWDELKTQERTQKRNSIAAAIAALTEAGFAIVPVTPTEHMVRAGNSQRGHVIGTPYRVWSAMIEAGSVKA
jgi:hypothetical protein